MAFFSKYFSLDDSRFLERFTDYHTHLLPGVDDGISSMEEALEALAGFERRGVECVWLTPHIMEDIPNTTPFLQSRFEELKAVYRGTIKLRLGAEYMLDNLFWERLSGNDLLPLEGNRLLVETSCFSPPMEMDDMLKRILAGGYFPVLAHPERYVYMKMNDFFRLKTIGVGFQLNLPSIAGVYGKTIRVMAGKLLKKNMYDFIGTDTHSLNHFRYVNNIKISRKRIRQLNVLAVLQLYNNFSVE